MSLLPKIEHSTYPITLPVSLKKLRFRPYLKKDDRILLQALEEGDVDEMYEATKQVITNCVTEGIVDVDKLPVVDVQYLLFQLRKRSVGNQLRLSFTCNNTVETGICGHATPVGIDVDDITLDLPPKDFNVIQITDAVGVVMKYPTYSIAKKLTKLREEEKTSIDEVKIKLVAALIEKVYTDTEVFEDFTEDDILELIGSLDYGQFSKLDKFLDALPVFKKIQNFLCKKCGYTEEITIEGFESFFV